MRPNLKRMIAVAAGAVLLFGTASAFAFPPKPVPIEPSYAPEHASKLLSEIRTENVALRLSAETLESFSGQPQPSWRTHAAHLEKVKAHINEIGSRAAELQRIRHRALPWQQQAITEVTSHAARVATSTQAALVYLNENQSHLFAPEYNNHLITIANSSRDMHQTVSKFLDFERTQQRLQRLQAELELSPD